MICVFETFWNASAATPVRGATVLEPSILIVPVTFANFAVSCVEALEDVEAELC